MKSFKFQVSSLIPRFSLSAFCFLLSAFPVHSQEALRYSMTGQAAAEARRHQGLNQPYTIKSGDFRLLVTPSLGLDYNSNINSSGDNPEDDFILKPLLQLNASYPVTQNNLLNLNIGVGYDYYFQNNNWSEWRINAGSELAFDMYVDDFWINFHDRFSYYRDPALESSIAGGNTADYGNLDNTVGALVNWDGNDLTASLGYDHLTVISGSANYDYLDRGSEMIVSRAGLKVHPEITTGVEGSVNFTSYDQAILNDNTAYSLGGYADWQPSSFFRVQPRIGYTIYDFRQTSDFILAEDTDSWYFDLTLSHQATKAITYSLSLGRQLLPGTQSDLTEKFYVRPNITWSFIKDWSFNTFFSYEHGTQSVISTLNSISEDYDWISTGIGLNHAILKRLSGGLNYRFSYRTSNLSNREYAQHLAGLVLTYQPR